MTKKKSGSGFQLGTILALVIMCVFLAISNSNFYSPSNIMGIFKQTAFNAFLAVGMLLCWKCGLRRLYNDRVIR